MGGLLPCLTRPVTRKIALSPRQVLLENAPTLQEFSIMLVSLRLKEQPHSVHRYILILWACTEIVASNQSLNVATYYDPVTTVKFNVYNGNQWVSYDDAQSWGDKMEYLTSHCLGGLMIWAIDQDTGQYDALAGLLGEDALTTALLEGENLSDSQKETLANQSVFFVHYSSSSLTY